MTNSLSGATIKIENYLPEREFIFKEKMMRSRDFKQTARQSLKGNWFVAIVAGFIASALGATSSYGGSVSVKIPTTPEMEEQFNSVFPVATQGGGDEMLAAFLVVFGIVAIIGLVYSIISLVIGSAVGIGYAQFNLDIVDDGYPKIGTLFGNFGQIKTAICAKLLMFLRIFVGFMLFFIPGIIAVYSYAMVNFVMAENPDMNAREALKESKRIMKGNRWRLFCLEISFFGWMLVSLLTLGLGFIWVLPYQQASIAAFYREAKENA